jgi:hypothetical protein
MTTGFGDLDRRGITPGRPPQVEGGDGSGLTEAELMEQELSPVWSELRRLRREFGDRIIETAEKYLESSEINDSDKKSLEEELANLRSFLDKVSGNPEGTEGLEIMIKIAFEYIQRLGINDRRSRQLGDLVVQIAIQLKEVVDNIAYKKQYPYETRVNFLRGLISLIVKLILSVGPNDSEFRGIKSGKYINHPNNDLSKVLDLAACVLLEEEREKALNNLPKLIGPISSLLEMTKELRPDELGPIYDKILVLTYFMIDESMENGDIDNSMKQLIINWCINYFAKHEDTFDQFVNELLNWIPPHLVSKETLSKELSKRASETGDTKYRDMASRLNRNRKLEKRIATLEDEITKLRIRNVDLKEEIAGLEEDIAKLRRELTELRTQVQILVNSNRNSN